VILWTFSKGRIKISLPNGTHSPRFNDAKDANDWLKEVNNETPTNRDTVQPRTKRTRS
jgi:hypothetical protein